MFIFQFLYRTFTITVKEITCSPIRQKREKKKIGEYLCVRTRQYGDRTSWGEFRLFCTRHCQPIWRSSFSVNDSVNIFDSTIEDVKKSFKIASGAMIENAKRWRPIPKRDQIKLIYTSQSSDYLKYGFGRVKLDDIK